MKDPSGELRHQPVGVEALSLDDPLPVAVSVRSIVDDFEVNGSWSEAADRGQGSLVVADWDAVRPATTTVYAVWLMILIWGLAAAGGLYLPESYPTVSRETLAQWRTLLAERGYAALAFEIVRLFVDDIPEADLRGIVERAYEPAKFLDPAVVPVGGTTSLCRVPVASSGSLAGGVVRASADVVVRGAPAGAVLRLSVALAAVWIAAAAVALATRVRSDRNVSRRICADSAPTS